MNKVNGVKSQIFLIEGKVTKNLSNGFYQVLLPNKKYVTASVSGKMRKYSIRILVNDLVEVEMSPYDFTRGRIIRRK